METSPVAVSINYSMLAMFVYKVTNFLRSNCFFRSESSSLSVESRAADVVVDDGKNSL